jgi:hypothetical protein
VKFTISSYKFTGVPAVTGWVEVRENKDRQIVLIQDKNIASCKFNEENVLIEASGSVEVWILRNGQLSRILNSGEKLQSSGGKLMNGDIFYLGTNSFFEKVTPEILKSPQSIKSLDFKPEGNVGLVILKVEAVPVPPAISPPGPILKPVAKPIGPIRLALASLIDKILLIIPAKKLYIKEDFKEIKDHKRKKVATLAGAILLALLIISIIFSSRQQKIASSQARYAGTLNKVEHDLDEAQSLVSVDATRARSLVLDANNETQNLISQKIKDDKITKLAERVANAMGSIAGLYNEAPSQYLDLTLQSSGFKGDDMASSDNRMVVLDKAGKRIISIDIDTSKTETVAGPDIMPNASEVGAYSDRNFVSADDGIWEVGIKAENLIKKDWGNNILISAYTGNFYILDKDNSSVWRYQGNGGSFDSKSNWFGAGIKPDLSNIVSWTIDGNMWMLTADGQILRFSAGSPINFTLSDLDKDLKAVDINSSQDSNYLYILDSGNSRVLVINKSDGTTKAQYVDNNIKNAKKLVVSEADKKIILLEGDKLYSLDIKHL